MCSPDSFYSLTASFDECMAILINIGNGGMPKLLKNGNMLQQVAAASYFGVIMVIVGAVPYACVHMASQSHNILQHRYSRPP